MNEKMKLLLSIKGGKMNLIDGFAIDCGENKRVITLKDGIYTIDYFTGTKKQTIKMIKSEYKGKYRKNYLKKNR